MKYLHILALLVLVYTASARPNKQDDKEDKELFPEDYTAASDDGTQNDEDYDEPEEEDDAPENLTPPVMLSKSQDVIVNPGENVFLPCAISGNSDKYVIMWYKGDKLLFQGNIYLAQAKNIFLEKEEANKTLIIRPATQEDEGSYTCTINIGDKNLEVVHKVEVRRPPKITALYTQTNSTTIEAGKTLVITCEAEGKPKPELKWGKDGDRIFGEGNSITIDKITHDRAGKYQCLAENKVGNPATRAIEIIVTHKPHIKLEKLTVNSAEDYESQLTCIVHAEPKPIVVWKKDGSNIVSNKNLQLKHEKHTYTLTIPKTKKSDFGSYTCSAQNHLGKAEKVVVLSGNPNPAEFVQGNADENKYHAVWNVESNSPITEYVLEYRKSNTHDWMEQKPEVTNPEGNLYTIKTTISDLEPVRYDIRLKSRNNYGWSAYSPMHHFDLEPKRQFDNTNTDEEQAEDPAANTTGGSSISASINSLLILASIALINRCF